MSKQIAVISGANGFIGKHLRVALEKQGITVIPILRKTLRNYDELQIFMRMHRPQYIYHLAAYGNMSNQKDEDETVYVNVVCTWNILEASKHIDYKALIHISTSSVLLDKVTFYSATKAASEDLCRAFVSEYNKPIVIIRPYSVYGPGEASFRFIPTVFRSCLTGEAMTLAPDAAHDWVYVEDFVQCLAALKDNVGEAVEKNYGNTFGFGLGFNIANSVVVKFIESITGKQANIQSRNTMRAFDNESWVSGPTELFKAHTPLEAGLREVYEYEKSRLKA